MVEEAAEASETMNGAEEMMEDSIDSDSERKSMQLSLCAWANTTCASPNCN